jgi:hypothetical protein
VTVEHPVVNPTFSSTVDVTPGAVTIVSLPAEAHNTWSVQTPQNNAVRLSGEQDFVAYLINRATFTSDAALGLPVRALNTEYIVSTYASVFGAVFNVTAAFDNTVVTITPSQDTNSGSLAGEAFEVTLNRGEGYLVQIASSGIQGGLSGSIVVADKPVALTNGNLCTQVPLGTSFCDAIFEMAPPVQGWGTEAAVVNVANRPDGSRYIVYSAQDNTVVSRNGVEIATLNRGQWFETESLAGSHLFSASNPVLVVQFMTGSGSPGAIEGDPAMGNVVPLSQFLDSYTFSTVGGGQFEDHFLTVIANNSDLDVITLSGNPIGAVAFEPIVGTNFSSALIPLAEGTYSTNSPNPHGIIVTGYNNDDSYSYPGGARFSFINPLGDEILPTCQISALPDGTGFTGNVTDEGSGIFFVELLPGANNVTLNVDPFVPGDNSVNYTVAVQDSIDFVGVVRATDGAGNFCESQLNGDPQCSGTDITNQLFSMDGGASAQKALVDKAARRLRRSGSKASVARKIMEDAQNLYNSAWAATWSIPAEVQSCLNPVACVEVNLTDPVEQYQQDVRDLRALLVRTIRSVERNNPNANLSALRKRAKRRAETNIDLSEEIPAASTFCSATQTF